MKIPNQAQKPDVYENVSLKPYNTFWVEAQARYFSNFKTIEQLQHLIEDTRFQDIPWLVLGGGSNVLFTSNEDGLVMENGIKGKEVIEETADHVWLKAYSGENWHQLVLYCVDRGWGGIENLSLIPGKVGAAPMQNIGAYGIELKDVFVRLETVNRNSGAQEVFEHRDCGFGYRTSVFKEALKDHYIIVSVTLKLAKNPTPNTAYASLKQELEKRGIHDPDVKTISDLVCEIRRSKLPYPDQMGNAGSFFKNPIVSKDTYDDLKKDHPHMPAYFLPNGEAKIPAGWLIEQCGLKGYREGNVGTHERQALVIVNHGRAKGTEIWAFAKMVQRKVKSAFNIQIYPEVNIL